ncbi:MAG: hypothetical protein ACREMN_05130, partial [Gemmatimonadales bacterium]
GELPPDAPSWLSSAADASLPTVLVVDAAQLVMTAGGGDGVAGIWSTHPLLVLLAERALGTVA